MSANIVQAQYETLDTIAARFNARAEATTDMHSHIMRGFEALTQDGWEGKGVAAFSTEMHGEIFPAVQRMTHALQEAQAVTLEAKAILQQRRRRRSGCLGGSMIQDKTSYVDELCDLLVFVEQDEVVQYVLVSGDVFVAVQSQDGFSREDARFRVKEVDDPNRPKVFLPN
jgi:WXG100 family type VII secretion target